MSAVTIEEMVARAEAMLPRLRERAAETEALRRLPDETIDEIRRAGFHRVFQPKRYGGYEMDFGPTQVALGGVLGRACGSTGWVQSIFTSHGWLVSLFPEAAQEVVWGEDSDLFVSTAFSTRDGGGRPVAGGYLLDGQWQFSSGVDACQWAILQTPISGDGVEPHQRFCLAPRAQWEIVDTWYASGLKGTGSKDVLVKDVFVPAEHTVDLRDLKGGPTPGSKVNQDWQYRMPITGILQFTIATPAVGMARGALEAYIEQTAGRPERAAHMARQLRVAESAAEIDAAEALLRADGEEIARRGRAGEEIRPKQQMKYLRDLAFAAILCVRSVDRLASAVGAHGVMDNDRFQRAFRDIHALANHVGVSWDLNAVPYGRTALGLDPGDPRLM